MSGTVLKTAGHAAPSPAQRSRRSSQSSAIHRQTARSRIVELGWELVRKWTYTPTDPVPSALLTVTATGCEGELLGNRR